MRNVIVNSARGLIRWLGFDVIRHHHHQPAAIPVDFDPEAAATLRHVQSYTMTSPERLFALIQAVLYVSAASVPGDIVECGVWRGGSMMAAARTLIECADVTRELYLFDTFEGMSPPTDRDVAIDGQIASALLHAQEKNDPSSAWCYATLEDVQSAMSSTGYGMDRIHFMKGKVEDTIPDGAPSRIAILRLDTDWYESTRHELEHLYPRLSPRGVLIIDDYGHWVGCRQAVDEYIHSNKITLLLNRVDYTGRVVVKTE